MHKKGRAPKALEQAADAKPVQTEARTLPYVRTNPAGRVPVPVPVPGARCCVARATATAFSKPAREHGAKPRRHPSPAVAEAEDADADAETDGAVTEAGGSGGQL